jgi:4-oxalocrotonate tautomerase
MPLVYINLMEGRPPERIENMITAVSEAIAGSLDADINTVRIMVNEMAPHQYGVGGKPWRVVQSERAAAQAAAEAGAARETGS